MRPRVWSLILKNQLFIYRMLEYKLAKPTLFDFTIRELGEGFK
jgi:hypothetical protein